MHLRNTQEAMRLVCMYCKDIYGYRCDRCNIYATVKPRKDGRPGKMLECVLRHITRQGEDSHGICEKADCTARFHADGFNV